MRANSLPPCTCPIATTHTHTDECEAAFNAYTDALLAAEAADALAAAATTVEEIDAAVTALRAVPVIRGRNSRPAITALLRRRVALVKAGGPSIDGPCPSDHAAVFHSDR